jgi:class 3 adenylate cyclase
MVESHFLKLKNDRRRRTELDWSHALVIGLVIGLLFGVIWVASYDIPWGSWQMYRTFAMFVAATEAVVAALKFGPRYTHSIYQVGPADLSVEATERIVTIAFIDIVGFSRMAEKQTPKEAFSSLKLLMKSLRLEIIKHGGYVDRTLGDGMLCVFGYSPEENSSESQYHADQALKCAAAIQRKNIQRILDAKRTGDAVFPLRIGINTAGVFIGNLGDSINSDFTVIGNGVNFASRLEQSCDRHMIMIGAPSRDLLYKEIDEQSTLRKRYIRIKHHTELQEAYEYDPFFGDEQKLNEGDEAYREFLGVERSETRWACPNDADIHIHTDHGDGEIINYSDNGFTIKLPHYYGNGVIVNMAIDSSDGFLGERLHESGVENIVLEIRWARPSEHEGYIHGCMIKNMSREQCGVIVSILADSIERHNLGRSETA